MWLSFFGKIILCNTITGTSLFSREADKYVGADAVACMMLPIHGNFVLSK